MGKLLLLLLIILLTFLSVAGYIFLGKAIIEGEIQIAIGQRQLQEGQSRLEAGRYELETGKKECADGKIEYAEAEDNLLLVLADKLLKGGSGFREAKERIARGERRITAGKDKVSNGERRFDAGKLELFQGKERLKLAKYAYVACAFGAALFASWSIVLGLRWWRLLPLTKRLNCNSKGELK